jgi:hypothetical protein
MQGLRSGVAACGGERLQVIARDRNVPRGACGARFAVCSIEAAPCGAA